MSVRYPQQARQHHATIVRVSAKIAGTLIEWSHHPTRAPVRPVGWCPILDGRDDPSGPRCVMPGCDRREHEDRLCRHHWHDAEDCEYCPTTRPRVQIARTEVSDPTYGTIHSHHNTIEQVADGLDAQMMLVLEARHRIFRDSWLPAKIRGAPGATFDGDVVQARNALLAATGDLAGHVERTALACPFQANGRELDAHDGWMDDHCRTPTVALGDCAHELERLARRWGITAAPELPTVERCSIDTCHKVRKYRRLCEMHYRAVRKESA